MNIFLPVLVIIIVLLLSMVFKNAYAPSKSGVKNGKLAKISSSPNAVSSQAYLDNQKVEPLKFIGNLEETRNRILNILNDYEGASIYSEGKDYIHAVLTSGKFNLKNDVEFYFDEKAEVVHFRSASRVGFSHRGKSRKNYQEIKDLYYKDNKQ